MMRELALEYMVLLARNSAIPHLKEALFRPGHTFWRVPDSKQFSVEFQALVSELEDAPEIIQFLELHLTTEYLLYRERAPEWFWDWIRNNIDVEMLLDGLDPDGPHRGSWLSVPVAMTVDRAYVRWFIVGCVTGCGEVLLLPSWAQDLLNDEAKEAVHTASLAASRMASLPPGSGLYCYPLTIWSPSVQFEGGSLGLPLGLGFLSAAKGTRPPWSMIASGSIDEDGLVHGVGRLDEKTRSSAQESFSVLLYPSENQAPVTPGPIELLPVSNLDQAWMFCRLYSPGRADDLLFLQNIIENPERFSSNWLRVDPEWLSWTGENRKLAPLLSRVTVSAGLFGSFVKTFIQCIAERELHKCEIVERYIDPESLKEAAENSPVATFTYHMHTMALANHRGRVEEAFHCSRRAEQLLAVVREANLDVCAEYHNHAFVTLHNLYRFSPDLPEELSRTLSLLEKRYDLQCEGGCRVDVTLGALYGSISQNFGFCGPTYFAQAEAYSLRAQNAFGRGDQPEFEEHRLRQLHYLAYAQLDAGLIEDAKKTLFTYLDISKWEELWPKLSGLSIWQHSLLARYCAQCTASSISREYLQRVISENAAPLKAEHPRQLWCFNLGRLAALHGSGKEAYELFIESLRLCLHENFGPTVRVMALLPLSGLQELGRLEGIDRTEIEAAIRLAVDRLDQSHFRILRERPLDHVLKDVWSRPGVLFPFTYH